MDHVRSFKQVLYSYLVHLVANQHFVVSLDCHIRRVWRVWHIEKRCRYRLYLGLQVRLVGLLRRLNRLK
jgi:hypothetical protein